MKLDKGRCKCLEPGRAPIHQHRQGAGWSEYGFAETDLCFVANKIDIRQQGKLVAKSVRSQGCIRESSISRQGEDDPSPPLSTGETHLEHQAQF